MTGPRDRDPYRRPGLGYDDEHVHDRPDYCDAHAELEVVVHLTGDVEMLPVETVSRPDDDGEASGVATRGGLEDDPR